jgi:prolyl 4-hydroxylase
MNAVQQSIRDWVIAQAQAGKSPKEVIEALVQSGWQEADAIAALSDFAYDPGTAAVPVPQPDMTKSPAYVDTPDRRVSVAMMMREPNVMVFGGLLSEQECDELIELAKPKLERSQTVENVSGGSETHAARTSDGMFFSRGEHPLVSRIEARLAALVNWPVENGEGLQILRYRPGTEYKPHHDYFDPAYSGTPKILERGGQRVATIVMYLNTPDGGGATTFPDVGLEVTPVKGNAVFFTYDRPHPDTKTLHGGAPVTAGIKWAATKWLRERRFV